MLNEQYFPYICELTVAYVNLIFMAIVIKIVYVTLQIILWRLLSEMFVDA